MAVKCIIKASQYYDSVTLMSVARDLRDLSGVEDAALLMGTDANKGLLKQAGLYQPEAANATPNDLVITIKGADKAVKAAMDEAENLLSSRSTRAASSEEHHPRSIRGAARSYPESNLVVISVSGQYAAVEAWAALRQGLHVLLFSDNVPLADEIALKRFAVENGLLMMGPGAGTAIINGVALAFANVVPRGPVGIVSAAGTGLQEVSSMLANHEIGISQGIGVGGRDLSDDVGGLMSLHAIDALCEDPDTKVIVAISKLPSPAIAEKVVDKLKSGGKPAVIAFMEDKLTEPSYTSKKGQAAIYRAPTLKEAALAAAALVQGKDPSVLGRKMEHDIEDLQDRAQALRSRLKDGQNYLRGLFSGGTLCEEAMRIWGSRHGGIWSNMPLNPKYMLPDVNQSLEHTALDLGEEQFTVGRPHPMIDHDLRIRRLMQEAGDPSVAVIQMDVVLGYGAHPDPASELAPAMDRALELAQAGGRNLDIVLSITGTQGDPQDLNRQRHAFEKAGALVMDNNADASYLAAMVVGS